MKNTLYLLVHNERQMEQLGQRLAQYSPNSCIIYLNGELGSGKTTLARGFLRGMGYNGLVKSPTYTIVEAYHIEHKIVYHFDLYRLTDPEELEYLGIRDYFAQAAIYLIEWAERGQAMLPVADIQINITTDAQCRNISLHSNQILPLEHLAN